MGKVFYEFFAGIGLVQLGLHSEGWDCIWANDISEDKFQIYKLNFGETNYLLKDIWKLSVEDIPGRAFLATASFPCTDLSLAGDRQGLSGHQSSTFFAFSRLLEALNKEGRGPRVVMLENVEGLLTSNKGKDISLILSNIANLGYVLDILCIDAAHFVPQSRRRIFVFGVKPEIAESVMVLRDDNKALSQWKREISSRATVRPKSVIKVMQQNDLIPWAAFRVPHLPVLRNTLSDILEDIPLSSVDWWSEEKRDKLQSQMSAKHQQLLNAMISKRDYSYGTVYRRVRRAGSMAELRTDGISGCLRTPRGGSSKQILVKAGMGGFWVRWMTPREYARLQGVSNSFILPSDKNKAILGLGDAVCVPVLSWIARHILNICFDASADNQPSKLAMTG